MALNVINKYVYFSTKFAVDYTTTSIVGSEILLATMYKNLQPCGVAFLLIISFAVVVTDTGMLKFFLIAVLMSDCV